MDNANEIMDRMLKDARQVSEQLRNRIDDAIKDLPEKDKLFFKDSLKEINTKNFDLNKFVTKMNNYADRDRS